MAFLLGVLVLTFVQRPRSLSLFEIYTLFSGMKSWFIHGLRNTVRAATYSKVARYAFEDFRLETSRGTCYCAWGRKESI